MLIIQGCEEIPFANPSSLYDILRKADGSEDKESYLLESREGSDKLARYSIIGFDPAFKFSVKNGILKTKSYDFFGKKISELAKEYENKNPLSLLKAFFGGLKIVGDIRRERFIGGFVGYLSYDYIRYFVDVGGSAVDILKQPDCEFLLTKKNVVADHKAKEAFLISNEFYDEQAFFDGLNFEQPFLKFAELVKNYVERGSGSTSSSAQISVSGDFTSNMEKEEYERGVRVAKEYIRAGDIIQVVLSQRLEADFDSGSDGNQGAFEFYKRLSEVNPSPYMYFLDFGERKIVGASPEMLVRVEAAGLNRKGNRCRKVETCPIAGTRRRGINKEEDKRLEVEMLNDEKERAEHLMLVDLARNDIGKVSAFGTVKATRFMYPEKYSHVQHIVTDVVGELRTIRTSLMRWKRHFPQERYLERRKCVLWR